jgi:sugar-specific transcriptional regulator TrmB
MLVGKDFLNRLKDFGLNSYEAKLWVALLSRGVSTAGELSDIAGVPRSRSYDVLESLEKKGFIIMKLGKPIKYIAVQPAEVVERVKKRISEEAESQAQVLEGLNKSEILAELAAMHKSGMSVIEPAELTGALKGRQNLYSHMQGMIKNATKSVLIITTEQGLIRKAAQFKTALKKAKDNGARIKIVAPLNKEGKSAASELSAFAQMKHSDSAGFRAVVIDGKQAIIMLQDDKAHPNSDFGIWANSEFLAKGLEGLF